MDKLLSPGGIAGLCSAAAAIATVFGKDALADYFKRPELPGEVLIVVGAVGPVVAGLLPSHRKPAAPAAPAA